jgi:hypothetical protein
VVAGRVARLPEPFPESIVHPSRAVAMPTDARQSCIPPSMQKHYAGYRRGVCDATQVFAKKLGNFSRRGTAGLS